MSFQDRVKALIAAVEICGDIYDGFTLYCNNLGDFLNRDEYGDPKTFSSQKLAEDFLQEHCEYIASA